MSKQYSIRLTDEAGAILDSKANKSQFIQSLLLGNATDQPVPWKELEYQIDQLREQLVKMPKLEAPVRDKADKFAELKHNLDARVEPGEWGV